MKSFDSAELQAAEKAYLETRTDAHLGRYYNLLMEAAPVLLRSYSASIGFRVDAVRVGDVCHDATTRMLESYWKRSDHPGLPVAHRLFQEVRYQLNNRTTRRYDSRVVTLEDDHQYAEPNNEPQGDESAYLREITEDCTVQGRRIVMTIFNSRFYRTAIKQISGYTPRAWIYRNRDKLHTIFRMTRGVTR